jgi:integrase
MRSGRLTTKRVAELVRAGSPGHWCDGGSLYLKVGGSSSASWIFRYRRHGRLRDAGLGGVDTWSLAEARERARKFRQLLSDGLDPIDQRRAERDRAKVEAARAMTFRQCAESYVAAHQAEWKSAVHAKQWSTTLASYAYPVLGDLPVAAIDTALVMKALEPLWRVKPETASRVRGRIESVLDWATVRNYRAGENPARWKGRLANLLPGRTAAKAAKRRESGRSEHLAAMRYADVPAFLARLRGREGVLARAIEFAILTCARTNEVVGARWDEIDIAGRTWTVPSERMKAGKEHRIPLSDAAIEILMRLPDRDGFVFPGTGPGAPLRDFALYNFLKSSRLKCPATVHGFRSSFADWAVERTHFSREERELALAHKVGTAVELAYRRSDMFERRRRLMQAWAAYCDGTEAGEVIPLAVGRG